MQDEENGILARVGRGEAGRTVTPVNQAVTPLGRTIELPGLRPQALALRTDGVRQRSTIVVTTPQPIENGLLASLPVESIFQ